MTVGEVGAPTSASNPTTAPVRAHILVIEDEPMLQRTIVRILTNERYSTEVHGDAEAGLAAFAKHHPDAVLLDCMLPGIDGLTALAELRTMAPDVPVVMMTGSGRIDLSVRAMREGAYDFIAKPFESSELLAHAISRALEHAALRRRARDLADQLATSPSTDLVGRSGPMQEVQRFIHGVSSSRSTVLVLGESGTGKELVARAIHRTSLASQRPFVCVNCAAIPGELLESELFGHVKGAFTGASHTRAGLFESANNGTIFLDEIGDLPLSAQAHLLRTLQEGEIRPVGSDTVKHVDVRVVAATNAPLDAKIRDGSFRQDLFYRLNVLSIRVPPLRERGDDIVLLAQWFIERLSLRAKRAPLRLESNAIERLMAYEWPGNVRELENTIERALVFAQGEAITAHDLPPEILAATENTSSHRMRAAGDAGPPSAETMSVPNISLVEQARFEAMPYADAKRAALSTFEISYLDAILARAHGNVAEAARIAGLDRSNFRRLVKRARGQRE